MLVPSDVRHVKMLPARGRLRTSAISLVGDVYYTRYVIRSY